LRTGGSSRTGRARLERWLGRRTTREHEIPQSADEERTTRVCRAGAATPPRCF
jgi:hypothetical protein